MFIASSQKRLQC